MTSARLGSASAGTLIAVAALIVATKASLLSCLPHLITKNQAAATQICRGKLARAWHKGYVVRSNQVLSIALRVEYAENRRIRPRNKLHYRFAHWPIWIWVFFLAPGPLTFDLFARGPSLRNLSWLICVLVGTGAAGLRGALPGVEARPYILHFCEDKPNPIYRRICYTFAWNALLSFALLNLTGLLVAVSTGSWYLKQIYARGYFPLLFAIVGLGALGVLPRTGRSTKGEGVERRYFYGAVWSVTIAQTVLLALWKALPRTHSADAAKLAVFVLVLLLFGTAATLGILPRTRPILPGEVMVAD